MKRANAGSGLRVSRRGIGIGLLLVLAGGTAGGQAQEPGGKTQEPDEFVTEIRLAVDRTRANPQRLKKVDLKQVEEVLKRRLAIFGSKDGTVVARSLENLTMWVPSVRVDELQLKVLCTAGRLEVRHLEDVRTSFNENGRIALDVRTIQGDSQLRFRDLKSSRIIPTEAVLKRCPVVLDTGDFEPDSVQPSGRGTLATMRIHLTEKAARRIRSFSRKPQLVAIVLDGQMQGVTALARPPRPKKEKKGKPGATPPPSPAALPGISAAPLPSNPDDTLDVNLTLSGPDEAGYMAVVLNSGALPGPLRVVSQKVINKRSISIARNPPARGGA